VVLATAMLTGIFSTTPMTAYAGGDDYDGGDGSETNTEQKLKQKNIGSGKSTNTNCGSNLIDTAIGNTLCPGADVDLGTDDPTTTSFDKEW
jgi:hypothetical protein